MADFNLGHYLFGAVKLTKNSDSYEYGYSGYGIGFDTCFQFSLPDGSWGIKMSLFLELLVVLLCILIIKRKVS